MEYGDNSQTGDVYDPSWTAQDALDLIASKWTLLILPALQVGFMRSSALHPPHPWNFAENAYATLRDLERNGLVIRQDMQTKPLHVEYHLSPGARGP